MAQQQARVHVHDPPRRTLSVSASPAAAWEEDDGDGRRRRRSPSPVVEAPRREHRERQPRCGEVAGGTAAECAAGCCCFPCAVLELVVLAAVRVPAALCRRAVLTRRRRRRAAKARKKKMKGTGESVWAEGAENKAAEAKDWPVTRCADELAEAEKEVWASFQGAGFWRSPSQREVKK